MYEKRIFARLESEILIIIVMGYEAINDDGKVKIKNEWEGNVNDLIIVWAGHVWWCMLLSKDHSKDCN